jgi:hypothetical protein
MERFDKKNQAQSLSRLIELAKGVRMSAEQKVEQRNSFVYGNTRIENEAVTREMVERIARDISARAK